MGYLYDADKILIRQVMELGGYRTQAEAVRAALSSYIARRLPKGQSIEFCIGRWQGRKRDRVIF